MARCEISDIVLTKQGKPKPEAPITIKVVAGAAGSATMYTSETGSGTISSLLTDEDGFFSVWMEEGRYEVHGGAVVKTVENINQASVAVGSIGAEAITAEKLHKDAVETAKIKNEAVTLGKLASSVQTEIKAGAAAQEESLGEREGTVKLDLSKASVFHVTVKGTTEFEITNAPAGPKEFEILVKQDATGGRTWSVKSLTWINTTPSFLTTAGLVYLVSGIALNSGAEILGQGGIEAIASEGVTTEKIANLAVTEAKLAGEAVSAGKLKGEAVTTAKLGAEAVTTTKILKEGVTNGRIENGTIARNKLNTETQEAIPIAHGRSGAMSSGKITIASPYVTATNTIIVTTEGATPVAVGVTARSNGVSFTVEEPAKASTNIVNWTIFT